MTDVIKDFEELISGKVVSYLKKNKGFEEQNITFFEQELIDLGTNNPLIIAFGNDVYNIRDRHFKKKYRIVKVPHYSVYIGKEDYREKVEILLNDF